MRETAREKCSSAICVQGNKVKHEGSVGSLRRNHLGELNICEFRPFSIFLSLLFFVCLAIHSVFLSSSFSFVFAVSFPPRASPSTSHLSAPPCMHSSFLACFIFPSSFFSKRNTVSVAALSIGPCFDIAVSAGISH